MSHLDTANKAENVRSGLVCRDFKPFERNSLRGFATLYFPRLGLLVEDVAIHERGDARWAQLPSKPVLDRDRALVRDEAGKLKYARVLSWDSRARADAFSRAALQAIDAFLDGRR